MLAHSVDTALPITTISLEILQQKLFGSRGYSSDLVCHIYIYILLTPAQSFFLLELLWTPFYISSACTLNLMNMLMRLMTTYQSQHKVLALQYQDNETPMVCGLAADKNNKLYIETMIFLCIT